jgi:ATP/maltotriose-dependent transcriptional regulator MalT/DNA-binding SARP family transcriptional activator
MELFSQVTRTQIILPDRRPDLLSRQRLLDLWYDLLDFKLIIVAAPAGYGKTSLLVDMAHHIDLPVCWYAIDALDNDPQRFLAHFVAAITQRFPQFGRQSAAVLANTLLDEAGLDQLATTMVNEAYEHIKEHFLLILDDYHLVNDKKINQFINRFVQQVDENCHVVISSRALVSLPDLVLMVARSQIAGLGLEDLTFRTDEIQALILQNYNLTVPQAEAEELAQETEGWITGLLLSAQTMWQGMADRLRLARISGVGLYDYMVQQVLDRQPPAVRDFLLRTSLLGEFNAQLCQTVLDTSADPDQTDWVGLMDIVVRNNLFVLPVDDRGTWLRYHHLFQDFLQSRMKKERPDETERILRRLAAIYVERAEWVKARELYQRLDDVTATADLIETAGLRMVRSGQLTTVAKWLDVLPASLLSSRPALLALRGYTAAMLGEVDRGLSLLNRAEVASRRAGREALLVQTLLWRSVAHRFLGKYQASLADADEALVLTGQHESPDPYRAEALKARGISLYRIGQLNAAVECLEQSLAVYTVLDEIQNVAMVLLELGVAYVYMGRYEQALTNYNQALDHWRKMDNITWQANLLNNLGFLHHLRGDYEGASQTFEEALTCARQSGYARIEAYALCGIGDLYADLEAVDAALAAYHQAREVARRTGERFLLLYLNLAEAALARSQRNLAHAQALVDMAGRLAQENGSDYEQGLQQLEAGRLALAENRVADAVMLEQAAAGRFEEAGQRVESARAYLQLAIACQAAGEKQEVIEYLRRAFRLTFELESQHPLVAASKETLALLEAVQDDITVGQQAAQLLQRITKFKQDIPRFRRRLRRYVSTVPFAPPGLTIQALGQARVTLDKQVVTSPEWQTQRRVRELFFYLLAHQDGLTREAIGLVFWPDSSPAQLKLQFKNTIYRLRRALTKDIVLFDVAEDRYAFNRQLDYDYDVEMFQREVQRARTETSPERQAVAYQAAIELYQGPYLPDIDGTWVLPVRERLSQLVIEDQLELAELYLTAGQYNLALKYCQQVLTEDPCLEKAHRQAMRAHAALGNRAAVIRQFEQCQRTLLDEVDAPVSPQTRELYDALTA